MGLPKLAFPGGRAKTTTIYYPAPAMTTGRPGPGTAGRGRSALVVVAVLGLLVAGCGSSPAPSAGPGPAFPSTPAGVQARWLFQALGSWPIPDAAIRAHFAPAVLATTSPADLNLSLADWKQLGLVSVTSERPNSVAFVVSIRGGQRFRVDLTVDAHGLINGSPANTPVLLTCSNADALIGCAQEDHLAAGLWQAPARLDYVYLDGVDHFLKEDISENTADFNESLPFSAQLRTALKTFLASNL